MKPSNKLKIKTLDKGWSDNDNIMLHACFGLLADCIENEKLLSKKMFDWDHNEKTKKEKTELKALYKWWKNRIKAEQKGKLKADDENQYKEDNEMLIRLVLIRNILWT
ncbi:MAG: hypothetical protein KA319_00705 [Ferruginibacter sp.]|nr:hypothetical protein [Ferruginibacter sp.]